MRARFDGLASVAATALVERMSRGIADDQREWLDAMEAEFHEIPSGWSRLKWALGAVRVGWASRRRPLTVASLALIGGEEMSQGIEDRFQNPIHIVAYSAIGLFIWWLGVGAAMRLANAGRVSNWVLSELVIGFSCLVGAGVAIWLRMSLLAWVLIAFVGFSLAEFSMHSTFGIKSVQGGPAHFTVIGAGLLAVLGFAQLEKRFLPIAAAGMAAVLAFVAAEALSHLVWGMNPFRDRVTHVAIVISAFVAPTLAAFMSRKRA